MATGDFDFRETADLIKDRIAIEEVIGRRVQLKRSGSGLSGLCPFHAEKTPSFHVRPDHGSFKCFGCQKGGDVFSFLMEIDGLEFMEAFRILAEDAGVELPKFGDQKSGNQQHREQAKEALSLARRLYHEELLSNGGADARAYLKDRGVLEDTAALFGLGWAPRQSSWLQDRLQKQGISVEGMVAAGLAKQADSSGFLRAHFFDRLMFPVADRARRTLGFCGRFLPGSEAEKKKFGKYVNSPEGPLFPKRRLLYGVELLADAFRAIPEDDPLILVEGNLDVLLMHQAGFQACVAALGTAVTDDHARMLRRTKRTVVLLLDGDQAGRRAALSAGKVLIAEGISVKVALLPTNEDPASLIADGKVEKVSQILSDSRDILHWRLDAWAQKTDFSDPAVQSRAAQEVAEWIQATPDPVIAAAWQRRAGDRLGITDDIWRRLLPSRSSRNSSAPASSVPPPSTLQTAETALSRNENEIVATLLLDPSLWPLHAEALEKIRLETPLAAKMLAWIRQNRASQTAPDLSAALAQFPEAEEQRWLDSLRQIELQNPSRILDFALRALPGNRDLVAEVQMRQKPGHSPSDQELSGLRRRIDVSAIAPPSSNRARNSEPPSQHSG